MPSSLGLIGDLDDVEMIEDVEQAFGFRFSDDELLICETVGDLFALIEARLPSEDPAGKCATAMTFYRLRRAIEPRLAIKLRPTTPITACSGLSVRELHRIIEKECGLRPPSPVDSLWGSIAFVLMVALPTASIALGLQWWIAVMSALLAWGIYRKMPIALPSSVTTFGDLVRIVSSRSIGALTQKGARLRAVEAWDAFRDVLSDHTCLSKNAIVPDTLLMEPEGWLAARPGQTRQ
jgi:hypothetical protein